MDDATVDRIMERLRLLLKAGRGSDKEIRTIDDIEEAREFVAVGQAFENSLPRKILLTIS